MEFKGYVGMRRNDGNLSMTANFAFNYHCLWEPVFVDI